MAQTLAFDTTREHGIDSGRDHERHTTGAVGTAERGLSTRALQRGIGNAQVCRVLRMATPGSAGTSAASGVAGNGADSPVIKRKQCHCVAASGASDICTECAHKHNTLQRYPKQASGPSHLPPRVTRAIDGGGGERLADAPRTHMESALGADLSGVRIHRDPDAAHAATDINAHAFTVGQHIYFGAGQYNPGTTPGNHLLAHELTHTLQQASGTATRQTDTPISSPTDPLEHEAEAVAAKIDNPSSQEPFLPRLATPPTVQGDWYDSVADAAQWVGGKVASGASAAAGVVSDAASAAAGAVSDDRTMLQRQVAGATPDPNLPPCEDLLALIKEAVAVLISRAADLINDPLGLQWDNWNVPKIQPDGTNVGSVAGHQQQYENWRTRLRNKIGQWDDDDCNQTGLRVPQDARDLQFEPAPAPTPRPRPAPDEPKPWEPPGAHRVGAAAEGAAIGAGAGLVVGGVIGALLGGGGGTLVAPVVGTLGGGGAGAVAGAEAGASVGAAIGTAIGGLVGWLTGD